MMTASIRLTGTLDDGTDVTRSYYLIADFGSSASGRASVVPLSMGAPMPEDDGLTASTGGEAAALTAAAEAIKALPGNRDLDARVVIDSE